MKHKMVRCKRCGNELDSKNYPEHLVKCHLDFSLVKKEKKIKPKVEMQEQEWVVMPTATICVRCKKEKIADFVQGTCIECRNKISVW
jgi:hypothetical protein